MAAAGNGSLIEGERNANLPRQVRTKCGFAVDSSWAAPEVVEGVRVQEERCANGQRQESRDSQCALRNSLSTS